MRSNGIELLLPNIVQRARALWGFDFIPRTRTHDTRIVNTRQILDVRDAVFANRLAFELKGDIPCRSSSCIGHSKVYDQGRTDRELNPPIGDATDD